MQRGIVPDYGLSDLRRWLRRLPIRWRLTVTFAAVMAVLLAALIAFLYLDFRSDLDYNINQSLRARAQDVAGLIRQANSAQTRGAVGRLPASNANVVQVLSSRGGVLAAGAGLSAPALLAPAELGRASRSPQLINRGESFRLYALPIGSGHDIVVVGVSLAERDAALDKLDNALAIGVPPALVLATAAAFMLATAALAPVEQMLGRLGEGLDRERQFVANASHELRMPLAVLRAELEVALREHGGEAGLRAAMRSAIAETDRIVDLARDLLLLAQAQDGTLPIDPRDVPVQELLTGLAAKFTPLVQQAGRSLTIDPAGPTATTVTRADPDRVEQAVGNLIDNTLRYGAGTITLSARETAGGVEIHVSDLGTGFSEAFLPHAFDRFSRADPARRRGGVGLGLAVVLMIAQAHGGQAGAGNLTGGGADVWLRLPAGAPVPG